MNRFENLGVIKNNLDYDNEKIDWFTSQINKFKQNLNWDKPEIVNLFHKMIPDFGHKETGKYLDSKM